MDYIKNGFSFSNIHQTEKELIEKGLIEEPISISLDFNNDSLISFDEVKPYKISLNHTLNFKVKKPKSDFQKRIKNLQNSIK